MHMILHYFLGIDLKAIPVLCQQNQALLEPGTDLLQELRHSRRELEALSPALLALLDGDAPPQVAECSLLGDLAKRLA